MTGGYLLELVKLIEYPQEKKYPNIIYNVQKILWDRDRTQG